MTALVALRVIRVGTLLFFLYKATTYLSMSVTKNNLTDEYNHSEDKKITKACKLISNPAKKKFSP